ncbi:MAG: aminomethyl-transferring glycine dehydrogenase subunit GcvPB [Anaerolineales bacterium]|nr:aminomethyl-transferring glycine dehydrogenase subunit GcvPB [Anaerolineales bacterium]MCW5854750.1 aminomethyl-transferring glycine dehydrogenase subunit GcvPB [Anaerolineales bacterium]
MIYDLGAPGRQGVQFPAPDVPLAELPQVHLRKDLPLPEVGELEALRHYTRLSQLNHSILTGFYPLGSCTMKYNPVINEDTARLSGFAYAHPLQPAGMVQGSLAIMYHLQEWLAEITGMAASSLQPAAGAHGELAGVMMIRAYHQQRGDTKRNKILIPDSAHGTNPATSAMSGYRVVEIPSDSRGNVDLAALKAECDDTLAGFMLTNPNTLGLFEEQVVEAIEAVHAAGGLVYGDGANMNALLGVCRPGDLGFDVIHLNLHKTFTTPHGGGGPGSGPVCVAQHLADFLPGPIAGIAQQASEGEAPEYDWVMPKDSIGRLKAFHGQFGMHVRAFTYILMQGAEGLKAVAEHAVLNANYLKARLEGAYKVAYDRPCMHEVVLEGRWADTPDVHALDISKRLMDYGFHPPTNYFPLIVREALMIEPTETEDKATLDAFAEAMLKIAEEAHSEPDTLRNAPHTTKFGRMDEVKAARQLVLCCEFPRSGEA